ncbi:MAG: HEAT repeat domain-containing protein [Candidatus Acidiferrales bacterium]
MNEKIDNGRAGVTQFAQSAPIYAGRQRMGHGIRLAIFSAVLVLPLAFFLALKPTSARVVWEQFARMIEFKGTGSVASSAKIPATMSMDLAALPPQAQAEFLLKETVNDYEAGGGKLLSQMESWRGELTMTPQLTNLLDSGLNSPDLRVRAAAIEMELVAYDLAKTRESSDLLTDRIANDPAGRSWALWMLGAIGNRGIEPEQTLRTLIQYSHDADEKTRFWAVEGMSLLGTDATIPALIDIFHNDPSIEVRERAGSALAQSGMLTKQQRMTAVPALMSLGEDPSLDSNTRNWTYQALRAITGARYGTNPTDWREWWAEHAAH